jgi:hypothetical protein
MQQGHSNDFQTPAWVLKPLIPYIPDGIVWECACGKGNLVKGLAYYIETIGTDLLTGTDFLTCNIPNGVTSIITNPPYTIKDKFLERCYEIGLPFALLMPLTALEGIKRQALYRKHGLELILLPRRIDWITPSGIKGGSWFASAWFTNGLNVGKELTFWQELEKI